MTEEAVLFGEGDRLSGVITDPPARGADASLPAVVIMHAGRIHRVGPNRLYVSLARAVASLGFTAMRFDLSGIGESDVRRDSTPFRQAELEDVGDALDYLSRARGVERFVLVGICSGASLSAISAARDPRVAGAVLINGQAYPATRLQRGKAHVRKLRRFWWKLAMRHPSSITRMLRAGGPMYDLMNPEALPANNSGMTPQRLLQLLAERDARILVVYSESDIGLDYLHVLCEDEVRAGEATGAIEIAVVPGADHVFTLLASQRRLVSSVTSWLARTFGVGNVADERASATSR